VEEREKHKTASMTRKNLYKYSSSLDDDDDDDVIIIIIVEIQRLICGNDCRVPAIRVVVNRILT